MEEMNEMQVAEEKRPKLLTVLGILTFVSLGGQFFLLMFRLIRGRLSDEELIEQNVQTAQALKIFKLDGPELTQAMETSSLILKQENDSFLLVQMIAVITIGLGLAGVLMMFKRNKLGFHLYIIYSLIGIGGIFLYLSSDLVTFPSLFFSLFMAGLFIFLYSRNLKWLK